jgi:hypothetical protein
LLSRVPYLRQDLCPGLFKDFTFLRFRRNVDLILHFTVLSFYDRRWFQLGEPIIKVSCLIYLKREDGHMSPQELAGLKTGSHTFAVLIGRFWKKL